MFEGDQLTACFLAYYMRAERVKRLLHEVLNVGKSGAFIGKRTFAVFFRLVVPTLNVVR